MCGVLRWLLPAPPRSRPYRAWPVGMGTQFLLMRVAVGGMAFWQSRFFYRLVRRVRQGVVKRVVAGVLQVAVTVHTGSFFRTRCFLRCTVGALFSRGHNQ
jgi:hypothetical protein